MKEEIEELWFKPYDEDSFLKNFCDVDYEKYLLIVVTDPNFSYFNQHALERKRYWDSGSVVFFDILEMLSNYFDLDTLDDRLVYVEDPIARKMSVKFKFWVDTERLYCLLFLALDDMMFNEERLLSSMIRFKRGLLALFEVYKPVMFEQVQFGKFMFNLKQHVLNLQKTFNQRKENLVALTKEIVTIINRIMKGERVTEREIQNELFRRLSKEIMHFNTEKIKAIEVRLYNMTVVPQQINIEEERASWNSNALQQLIQKGKWVYNPDRLEEVDRQRQEVEDRHSRRKNFLEMALVRDPDSKSKSIDKRDKMSTRTRFNLHRVLQRSGNYPYNFRNILYNDFHDDLVRLKEENQKEDEGDSDMENDLLSTYYEDEFMNRLRKVDRNYAKVSKADIIDTLTEDRHLKQGAQKTVVTDIRWVDLEELKSVNPRHSGLDDSSNQKSMFVNDSDGDNISDNNDSEDELVQKSTLKNYMADMRKDALEQARRRTQSRRHFNVYQSKHSRDAKGWGLIRCLYNELKVKRKMSSFLKEGNRFFYYINRMDVQEKRKQAL